MSTDDGLEDSPRPRRERKSRMPCIMLVVAGGFVLALCYVTIVVVRNISPTAIRQAEGRRATATVQSVQQSNAGATIAVELEVVATHTALAQPPGASETPIVA